MTEMKKALSGVVSGERAIEHWIHLFFQEIRFVEKLSQYNWWVTTDISSIQFCHQNYSKFLSDGALPNVVGHRNIPSWRVYEPTFCMDIQNRDSITILDTWDGIIIMAPILGITQ